MKTTLNHESTESILARLHAANAQFLPYYPGEPGRRQPVHVVYGGAHLFKAETVQKLGVIAQRTVTTSLPAMRCRRFSDCALNRSTKN